MIKARIEIAFKKDCPTAEVYVRLSRLIRNFIALNNKGLKERHYQKTFSNYTFGLPMPFPKDRVYREGKRYVFELRSTEIEFNDLRAYPDLETDAIKIIDINCGKDFYIPNGFLKTGTPLFMKTDSIRSDEYEEEVKEKIRENMVFRALKSSSAYFTKYREDEDKFIHDLRNNVFGKIEIDRRPVSIPTEKVDKKGKPIISYCLHVKFFFKDNRLAQDVERELYYTGIGKLTSNGYGYLRW